MSRPPRDEAEALRRFLELRFRDEDAGNLRSREQYRALFPDFADAIGVACDELAPESAVTAGDYGSAAPGTRRLGPYELIERRGRGGQGEVYLARDTRLSRSAAVKVLSALPLRLDASSRARFRREAELASRLEHPGICRVLDMDLDSDPPWIAMPWIEGDPLARVIAEVPRERADVLDRVHILERVARAVGAGHAAGIVHRDVKPGNVIVRAGGAPILLDFGLARDMAGQEETLTRSGEWLGTLPYMAPEQVRGDADRIGPATDVWALGVTLHEALAGMRPFTAPSQELLVRAILDREPADVRDRNPAVPQDLAVVIGRALEKDSSARYADATAFADELARVREDRPILARPVSAATRAGRWARRNPALAASFTFALLALSTGLVVSLVVLAARTRTLEEKAWTLERLRAEERLRRVFADELRLASHPALAESLWPAEPALVTAPRGIDWWLAEARGLVERQPQHAAYLAELERGDFPRRSLADPRARQREADLRDRRAAVDPTLDYYRREKPGNGWIAHFERRREELARELEEVEVPVFADPARARLDASLRTLVAGIPRLEVLIAEVERRRELALALERKTVAEELAAWREATDVVAADPRFTGVRLEPITGLVPLGADPESGLVELAHVLSGKTPERVDGTLVLDEDGALVFVLIPGGETRIGAMLPSAAQPEGGPHVDPLAREDETPLQEVRLDPFLLAKYPMTQGQWSRLAGRNPSYQAPNSGTAEPMTLLHPVEGVSWEDATALFAKFGLVLPTEAQWEHAARAGTTSPWWTGAEERSVSGAGNIADCAAARHGDAHTWTCEDWLDDGHYLTSPVGRFRANPFGLHDVIGNVFEWCRDNGGPYGRVPLREGDGLRLWAVDRTRSARGGSYASPAEFHRTAQRASFLPAFRNPFVGVRPAMRLRPR